MLSLAPFIFDLHLYGIGQQQEIPSLYEYDPYRFESLPPFPNAVKAPTRPRAPKPLNQQEYKLLKLCSSVTSIFVKPQCDYIKKRKKNYDKAKKRYNTALKKHAKAYKNYLQQLEKRKSVDQQYQTFTLNIEGKPETAQPSIKQTADASFTRLLSKAIMLDSWRITGTIIWIIGLALIIPAIFYSVRKKCWSLLIVGLSIPAFNYLIICLSLIPGLEKLATAYVNSTLLAQAAFLWFAFKGHVRSKSFAFFLLTLSISVSIAVWLGDSNHTWFKANLPIIVFIFAACIVRLAATTIKDNLYLFSIRGWADNALKFSHAFLLWLPLGAFTIGLYYLSGTLVPNNIIDNLHKQNILLYQSDHNLLENALQSTAIKTDDAVYAWHLTTESIKIDIYKKSDALQKVLLSEHVALAFDKIMPSQLDYSTYTSDAVVVVKQTAEIAVNAAQESTNEAYKNLRKKMKLALVDLAKSYEKDFDTALDSNTAEALSIMDQVHQEGVNTLLELNQVSQQSLWWSINSLQALRTFTTLIFIFIAIKSFLYVFARVRFNRHSGLYVTLGDLHAKPNTNTSGISAKGLHYPVTAHNETVFYISRRFQCRGRAPRFSIPQPLGACVARLMNKSFSMNKIIVQECDAAVKCTATKGIEFFEWELQDGEQVIFDFHNFVGMTESITFSTLLSARVSSLLFGKMLYSVATGPGKLILMAEGRAEINTSELPSGSFPPERIIAADIDARFQIDSEIDLVNIYLSTAYVRPLGVGKMIVDVDSLRGVKTGLGSFIKRFMLPV